MIETKSNPMADFLYGIASKETKRAYIKKIKNFFDFLGLEGQLETQAQALMQELQKNKEGWIVSQIMNYIQSHKERAEKGEISYSTVRNYYKPVKLFFEMNDINIIEI